MERGIRPHSSHFFCLMKRLPQRHPVNLPLPRWTDVFTGTATIGTISVSGIDRIRGEGVYQKAVENLKNAARPPIVHMTISKINQNSLERFVQEMMALPIKGMGFSFVTPNRGMDDDNLFISLTERNRMVMELLRLRKKYGEKVGFTPAMARQLLTHGAFNQWNNLSTCPVSQRVRCYRSDGQPKVCTYGDQADCSRCGCAAVVAYRGAFKPFDYQTLRVILGLMTPEYQAKRSIYEKNAEKTSGETNG